MLEKEYIDREAMINTCKKIIQERWNETTAPVSWSHAYADFIDDINNQPAADVAPVKHGGWRSWETEKQISYDVIRQYRYYSCSVCNRRSAIRSNYCPNCGADMSNT